MPWGFPDSSAGKESTCNAGDPGVIPGSGRSLGEGKGYSNILAWRIPWTIYSPWGCKELDRTERLSLSLHSMSSPFLMQSHPLPFLT